MSIDFMNVKKVDLNIHLISGSVYVGFKSSTNIEFLSQTGVLCCTYLYFLLYLLGYFWHVLSEDSS